MVNPEKYVLGARMVPTMNKMRKMKNKKGFTLMEMLIVVAIIAILIAIAIPTFASSLNKARVATDEANIRSGYASVMTDVLTDDNYSVEGGTTGEATYKLNKDGSVTIRRQQIRTPLSVRPTQLRRLQALMLVLGTRVLVLRMYMIIVTALSQSLLLNLI